MRSYRLLPTDRVDAVTIAPCQSLALEHSRSRDEEAQEIGSEYDNLPGVIPRWLLYLALFLPAAGAYTPAVDSAGSLTIRILDPTIGNYGAGGAVTLNRTGAPFPLAVSLENHGDGPLQGVVRISVIDRWTVQPASPVSFRLKAHASRALEFTVTVGQGSFNANYPIHAYAEFGQDGQRPILWRRPYSPAVAPAPWRCRPGRPRVSIVQAVELAGDPARQPATPSPRARPSAARPARIQRTRGSGNSR